MQPTRNKLVYPTRSNTKVYGYFIQLNSVNLIRSILYIVQILILVNPTQLFNTKVYSSNFDFN
jgi:hypothetical protein